MGEKSVEKLLILLKEKALSAWGKALLCFSKLTLQSQKDF